MKPTVLIVDDDESIRVSLKLLLEEKYNVITVLNGEEALNKLNQIQVDAVILDYKMNDINALEILRRIREKNKCLVVIILSVIDDIKVKNNVLKLGANAYLEKPYSKKELLMCLDKNLNF